MGYPAKPYREEIKVKAAVNKLPEYTKRIRTLEQRIEDLEKKLSS